MKEISCNFPNCNGKREIRRDRIVCPYCDSVWFLTNSKPIEVIEKKPIEKPIQVEEEERTYTDESWLSIASALIGAALVIACIIIPLLI